MAGRPMMCRRDMLGGGRRQVVVIFCDRTADFLRLVLSAAIVTAPDPAAAAEAGLKQCTPVGLLGKRCMS